MGDSLTEGDGNPSAYRYQLFEKLWTAGIDFRFIGPSTSRDDVRLPRLFAHHGGNCGYIIGDETEEHGGAVRKNLRNAAYAEEVKKADIVLLWIGTNDYGQNIELDKIGERYIALLDEIWKLTPEAVIFGASMLSHKPLDDFLRDKAPGIADAKGKRFIFVQLPTLDKAAGDFPEDDGHPSEQGNEKIAQAWFDAIIDTVRAMNLRKIASSVNPLVRVDGVKLYRHSATLKVGEACSLTAHVYPDNADVKTLVFDSSDTGVCTVDRYGRIFAHAEGDADVCAHTLDGNFTDCCKIKVGGHFDISEGFKLAYESDMTTKDGFEGDIDSISTNYNKFIVRYQSEPRELRAKTDITASDRMLLTFDFRTANHGGRSRDSYSSVSFGRFELRVCGLASHLELYDSGELIAASVGCPIAAMNDIYALRVSNCRAEVFVNGELKFALAIKHGDIGGGLKLNWHEFWAKSQIKDVRIYL